MATIKAIRGMPDILPDQTALWQFVERTTADLLASYAYREIRFPIVEQTELFKRSIGEVTDIVEKEMYSFEDRNGVSITLRPEGTAGCVRAVQQNNLATGQPQRLWYSGPMFRYERPQKGRQRQFHQVGVEAFGFDGPDIDVELIALTARLWKKLGIEEHVVLEINSLGDSESRARYRGALVSYLRERFDLLDEDSQRRLESNPLRILDSKNPEVQALLEGAPSLHDFLDDKAQAHFKELQEGLDTLDIKYRLNPRLVRGLDYYNKTVFEWITDSLGAQGTVCAGGRYDGLVEQLGGKHTPAVGFAMGIERLCLLLGSQETGAGVDLAPHVYFLNVGDGCFAEALRLSEQLRDQLPELRLQLHCGSGSMKSQMKKADKSGALYALILAEQELAAGQVAIKSLRADVVTEGGQQQVKQQDLAGLLAKLLGEKLAF